MMKIIASTTKYFFTKIYSLYFKNSDIGVTIQLIDNIIFYFQDECCHDKKTAKLTVFLGGIV